MSVFLNPWGEGYGAGTRSTGETPHVADTLHRYTQQPNINYPIVVNVPSPSLIPKATATVPPCILAQNLGMRLAMTLSFHLCIRYLAVYSRQIGSVRVNVDTVY